MTQCDPLALDGEHDLLGDIVLPSAILGLFCFRALAADSEDLGSPLGLVLPLVGIP